MHVDSRVNATINADDVYISCPTMHPFSDSIITCEKLPIRLPYDNTVIDDGKLDNDGKLMVTTPFKLAVPFT